MRDAGHASVEILRFEQQFRACGMSINQCSLKPFQSPGHRMWQRALDIVSEAHHPEADEVRARLSRLS